MDLLDTDGAGVWTLALDNAELHANIQALSLTDVLTGVSPTEDTFSSIWSVRSPPREGAGICPWCSSTSTNSSITTTPWATW